MKLFVIFAMLFLQLPLRLSNACEIEGVVIDSEGAPVERAAVEAVGWRGGVTGKVIRLISDEHGAFIVPNLDSGTYRLYAWKEAAGVPYARALIFQGSDHQYVEAVVNSNARASKVVLKLPPPYGTITGKIVDSNLKQAIPNARIRLEREDKPGVIYETNAEVSGTFKLQLPSQPIKLFVSAPNYVPWTYRNESGANSILIQSGNSRELLINMVRIQEGGWPASGRVPIHAQASRMSAPALP